MGMSQCLCPFCAESILASAKVCRHCRREVSMDLWLEAPLHQKDLLSFLKNWQSVAPKGRSLKVLSSDDLKKATGRYPVRLAWDLSPQETSEIQNKLPHLPLAFKSKTESTALSEELDNNSRSRWPRLVVGGGILAASVALGFAWFNRPAPVVEVGLEEPSSYRLNENHIGPAYNMPEIQRAPESPSYPSESPSSSEPPTSRGLSRQQVEKLLNATVYIRGTASLGTGFLISKDGYILSNAHVTSKMDTPLVMLRDGRAYKARKIKEDTTIDIALIKIEESKLPFLEMGDANKLYPGQSVLTIGNPSGLSFTVTEGIVSFLGREIKGVQFIQTDAAINPGNSGGPMITGDLKVVGINTLTSLGQSGISFALPINYAYQRGGIARGFGTAPAHQPEFQANPTDTMVASLQPAAPGPSASPDSYIKEADELKANFDRLDQDIRAEFSRLETEIKFLSEKKKQVGHDNFKAQEVQRDLSRLETRLRDLGKNHLQVQLQYLDQVISLLQRQKGDSRFEAYSNQIDAQIQELQNKKRELEKPAP